MAITFITKRDINALREVVEGAIGHFDERKRDMTLAPQERTHFANLHGRAQRILARLHDGDNE